MKHEHLRIGHLSTFYHTSFILEGTDWLKDDGVQADWELYASGPDLAKALKDNDVDLAYMGLPPAISSIARGLPIKCIAGGHMEGTVMIGRSDRHDISELGSIDEVMKQFKGSVVGTPPKGSIHDVIARDIIECSDLDIEIKNYAWADFVMQALIDDELPAAFGTPLLAVASMKFGQVKVMIPPNMIWPNNPSYGIISTTDMIKENNGTLLRFLKQHERACELLRNEPFTAAGSSLSLSERWMRIS